MYFSLNNPKLIDSYVEDNDFLIITYAYILGILDKISVWGNDF